MYLPSYKGARSHIGACAKKCDETVCASLQNLLIIMICLKSNILCRFGGLYNLQFDTLAHTHTHHLPCKLVSTPYLKFIQHCNHEDILFFFSIQYGNFPSALLYITTMICLLCCSEIMGGICDKSSVSRGPVLMAHIEDDRSTKQIHLHNVHRLKETEIYYRVIERGWRAAHK